MPKNWKFLKKLKQVRLNRAVYLSTVIVLLALAAILTITAVTNRAKRNAIQDPPDSGEIPVIAPPSEDPGDSDIPVVLNPIPEFRLPVKGKLLKAHSSDVPVFSQTLQDYRVHLGIDILTQENAPVCAAATGTVARIWEDPMMGWCVAVSHSGDCMTIYKNLSSMLATGLSEGGKVLQGQLIGYVGDSALCEIAEEPHLHMEVVVKGLQVNPLDHFSAAVISDLAEDTSYESPTNPEK